MGVLLTPSSMPEDEVSVKRRKLRAADDEDDDCINELLNCHPPLSHLPTPPLSQEPSPNLINANGTLSSTTSASNDMTAAARFIVDIIRIREKSVPFIRIDYVEQILLRSGLDDNRIAFAACILYRLSWRFVRDWKNDLLSRQLSSSLATPEIIVLAAFYIACSWLDDRPRSIRFWVEDVAHGISRKAFLCSQMSILNDPSTSLMSIDARELEEMWVDMGCDSSLNPEEATNLDTSTR